MEHVPLPHDRIREPVSVRCLCRNEELYGGGDFAGYPARVGWPELIPVGVLPHSISYQVQPLSRLYRQEVILQAWCFFGLLHTLLAPFGLYDAQEYIRSTISGERYITTTALAEKMQSWSNLVEGYPEHERHEMAEYLMKCLSLAELGLNMYHNIGFRDADQNVRLSLVILSETIHGTARKTLNMRYDWQVGTMELELHESAKRWMKLGGWCPFEIKHAERLVRLSAAAVWYIQYMRKPHIGVVHTHCTEEACKAVQIGEDYETKHVSSTCTCDDIGPDLAEIQQGLRAGRIPLLEISGDNIDNVSINVRYDQPYVAISHVWVDGLGNEKATELRRCQVLRLWKLISEVSGRSYWQGASYVPETRRMLLWCDTLCCPVDAEHKKYALEKMGEVYTNSAYVLVLDKQLEYHALQDMSMLEIGIRVLTSRYNKRLWTYQEAGLAQKLLVQLRDGPVDFWEILNACSKMPVLPRKLCEMVLYECNSLRAWNHVKPRVAWLREAARAIAWRRVKVDQDQPICMATILGLSTTTIFLKQSFKDRMAALWSLISEETRGIPESIIFNTNERLDLPGYRWAPASFLQPITNDIERLTMVEDDKPGQLTTRGMRVNRPGWKIVKPAPPDSFYNSKWQDSKYMRILLHARARDGSVYKIQQYRTQFSAEPESLLRLLEDRDQEWYVILQREACWEFTGPKSQQYGLLVSKGPHSYQSIMIVMVDRFMPVLEAARQIEYIYADMIRRTWLVRSLVILQPIYRVCHYIAARLPFWWLQELPEVYGYRLGSFIGTRIASLIKACKEDAPDMPEAAKILDRVGKAAVMPYIGGTILPAWINHFVNIVDSYDDAVWYVD